MRATDLHPTDPFNRPPVIEHRVCLEEILQRLRETLPRLVMRSALGLTVHVSRPLVIKEANGRYPSFPLIDPRLYDSGLYALASDEAYPAVFAHLLISGYQVIINLRDDSAIVRLEGPDYPRDQAFTAWAVDTNLRISVPRFSLDALIKTKIC
jgi:hypothetical protein